MGAFIFVTSTVIAVTEEPFALVTSADTEFNSIEVVP